MPGGPHAQSGEFEGFGVTAPIPIATRELPRIIEIGSIVRVKVGETRFTEERMVPAIVLSQWPDYSLQLYCLHPEQPFMRTVPLAEVEVVVDAGRIRELSE